MQPAPPPMPVLPLGYTMPMSAQLRRPGIITAIGVMSIVFASLGMGASVVGGIYAVALTAISTSMRTLSSAPITTSTSKSTSTTTTAARTMARPSQIRRAAAAPNASPAASDDDGDAAALSVDQRRAGPRGVESGQRVRIVNEFGNDRPLSDAQRERLIQLLAKAGKDILPFTQSDGGFNDSMIRANISDSGQLPSASADRAGAVYFIIGTGKLEISDDRAAFFPSEPGAEAVRIARGVPDAGVDTLSKSDIDAILLDVQGKASASSQRIVTLTPAQQTTIAAQLSDPKQTLINVSGAGGTGFASPVQQVTFATSFPDGSIVFRTFRGVLQVDVNGNVTTNSTSPFAATPFANLRIRRSASTITILESVLSGALAIVLLVAGIMTLRQSASSRRLHLIYAWLKLGVVALGAVGWTWMLNDWSQATLLRSTVPGSAGAATLAATMQVVFAVLVSIAYPIALIIALQTKAVRDYFRSEPAF